jgi:cytochrome c-type biogenesis protein CcmE
MDSTTAPGKPMSETQPREKPKRRGYPIIIAGMVCFGAILVVTSSFSSGTYSLEIKAVAANPDRYVGHDVKIVGVVKVGSIDTRTTANRVETHFVIHDGQGNEVAVNYPHNPPDPFKEEREVIVEGEFLRADQGAGGVVLCHKLTVKCPSKYQDEGGIGGDGRSEDYYRQKYGSEGASQAAPAAP